MILMTQQEQNVTEYFIGSKAQSILNKSTIPVLTIVPQKVFA